MDSNYLQLLANPKIGEIEGVWEYHNLDGLLSFVVVRYKIWDKDGNQDKTFRPWIYNSTGWHQKAPTNPRPMYNLVELAAKPDFPVLIVEGEKTAEAARRIFPNYVVTTSSFGAASCDKTDWKILAGRKIVIWPDNDLSGAKYAEVAAEKLNKIGVESIELVPLPPSLPKRWDLADPMPPGMEPNQIYGLINRQNYKPNLERIYTATELMKMNLPPVSFVVEGLIPEGLTILAGKPKIGKSWLMLGIAVCVISGQSALGQYKTKQGKVLYLALEDSERRFKDRLQRVHSHFPISDNLIVKLESAPAEDGGIESLQNLLNEHSDVKLVIIDTLQKFKKRSGRSKNMYADDYSFISKIKDLADRNRTAVILVHHLRKTPSSDTDVFDEISGSLGLTGSADTIFVLKKDRGSANSYLHFTGRDVEESQITLTFKDFIWVYAGTAAEARMSPLRLEILKVIKDGEGLRWNEVFIKLKAILPTLSEANLKTTLTRMTQDGQLVNNSKVYNLPDNL